MCIGCIRGYLRGITAVVAEAVAVAVVVVVVIVIPKHQTLNSEPYE